MNASTTTTTGTSEHALDEGLELAVSEAAKAVGTAGEAAALAVLAAVTGYSAQALALAFEYDDPYGVYLTVSNGNLYGQSEQVAFEEYFLQATADAVQVPTNLY